MKIDLDAFYSIVGRLYVEYQVAQRGYTAQIEELQQGLAKAKAGKESKACPSGEDSPG